MTIPTTNVRHVHVDIDGIRNRRDADLATQAVLRARCSEAERNFLLSEIETRRRQIEPIRSFRRVSTR